MNKRSCIILICSLLCLVLLLGACGKRSDDPGAAAVTVNLQDWEGEYVDEIAQRGVLTIKAIDDKSCAVTVDWPSSAFERSSWEMTAVYDAEKNALVYSDAVRIDKTFDADNRETDKVVYTRGTGSFTRNGDKILWTDEMQPGFGTSTFVPSGAQIPGGQTVVIESPTPSAVPIETPQPEPAPSATPAPAGNPIITKDPYDEEVPEGGSCAFIARYENAIWAVWHFVSPDGKIDITYDAINTKFPTLEVWHGEYSTMKLYNIPLEMNGWRVYCRYSNKVGHTDTKTALITVKPGPSPTATPAPTAAPAPTATPEPAPEPTSAPEPTEAPQLGPVVNEWTDTSDLNEAIQGSGVSFTPPLDQALPEGLSLKTYRYCSNIIEADYADGDGSVQLTIRKSTTESGSALSGDYNSYSRSWDLPLKGVMLRCLGDGQTVNTVTFDGGGGHFSISYHPGQEGRGLSPDQLNSLINCIQ